METDAEKFERMKKRVDDIRVKKMAAESEAKRLSEELEECKKKIKSTYGVEIEDFAKAIETLKIERDKKMQELERLLSEAEQKLEACK